MEVDIFNKSIGDLVENVNRWSKYDPSASYQYDITYPPKTALLENVVDEPNMEISFVQLNGTYNYSANWQAHIELLEGARFCYGLYTAKKYVGTVDTGDTLKNIVLLGYSTNGTSINRFIDANKTVYGATSQQNDRMIDTDNNGRKVYSHTYGVDSWRYRPFLTFGANITAWGNVIDSYKTSIIKALAPSDNTLRESIDTIQTSINNVVVGGSNSFQWFNGLYFNMGESGQHAESFTYKMLPFPVFNIEDTDNIINYLNTGDRTGEVDIFDTNPKKEKIEDLSTVFKVFVSADEGDKTKTHFSIIAYNDEYIAAGEDLAGDYGLKVWYEYMKNQTSTPTTYKVGSFVQAKYPTCGIEFSDVGYSLKFEMLFNEMSDTPTPRTLVYVGFERDATKACNCRVTGARFGDTVLQKTGIKDGYRYTHPTTGETIAEVYFRAADIDDLHDNGYEEDDDNEDETTGDDISLISGSGYGTFVISDSQFATINKKLWSTDWTQVFKSNSVNPIQCVIGCKSLPFSATGASYGTIKIANLDTGVEANKINPVKTLTVGSVNIPPYRGDFTDIEGVRIHLYLPFIGWVELPASEVVGRRGFDGVAPKAKTLSFKYIVDFIDGHVRCVISVSGTERWYFDGNCAIDIPVTSDNHTAAISTAIKSGVASVMSVASAVAGAYTGNGFMVASGVAGAVENMANTIPTYNYSASASPAGYINASMNNHIMIVIERPNIVETADYAHVVGRPCGLYLSLAGLSGFTKCANVDVSGIPCTPEEQAMIKSALENGVYL